MASSNGSDVTIIMNTSASIRNNGVITGSLPTGEYNSMSCGINQQIPSSGAVHVVPSGYYTVPDNGYLDTRFDNPTYYTA